MSALFCKNCRTTFFNPGTGNSCPQCGTSMEPAIQAKVPPMPSFRRWEYSYTNVRDEDNMVEWMNKLGEEGWELVHVMGNPMDWDVLSMANPRFIFKREKL